MLEPPSTGGTRFSATKGYELDPDYAGINRYGLRDREFPLLKPPNTFRLLVLGDSFTYGASVTSEETYVKHLERMLNKRLSDRGIRYEVLNAGVPGYTTHQELLHLQEVGLQFSPDVILIGFTLSDAEIGYLGLKHVGRRVWLIQLKEWIKAHSALYSFVRLGLARLTDRLNAMRHGVEVGGTAVLPLQRAAAGETNIGWELCRQSLAGFASIARELDIPILLIIYPILIDLDDRYPFRGIHTLIAKTASDYDMGVVDLLPQFMGQDPEMLWVSPKDSHPNGAANAIAASAIYDTLCSHAFIECVSLR